MFIISLPTDIFTYPDVSLPDMWTVEQRLSKPSLTSDEVAGLVMSAMNTLLELKKPQPGSRVAIGVGSRGLCNLSLVVQEVISSLKMLGCHPFIVPAMGSHGGATAEGQLEILEEYGITEAALGVPVLATMEVVTVGRLEGNDCGEYEGFEVYCDKYAFEADHILLINRIKPHTDFTGQIESGIGKMSAIGLGKRHGADAIHRHGAVGLANLIPRIARYQASHLPLLGGIALIENESCQTCEIHPLTPEQIGREPETELLKHASSLTPKLPFDQIDVLIVDEMGKEISGSGMDTHVLGRLHMPSLPENIWGGPEIRVVAVLDLTEASHGNATALGLANITTEKLISKVDFEKTLINLRTSGEGSILRSSLPLILPTEDDCVKTAIATCGRFNEKDVRVVRIRNTARLSTIEISEALLSEARQNPSLVVSESCHKLNVQTKLDPVGQ